MASVGLKLRDQDLTHGFKGLADCEDQCNGLKDCVAINWHESDLHCHVLSGTGLTKAQFEASLQKGGPKATACVLVKAM